MSQLIINKLSIKHKNKQLVDLVPNKAQAIEIKDSLALVGESGSGKSLTLKTILQMPPKELDILFDYDSSFELNSQTIGFIPQNPFTSLSPMTKILKQFFCIESEVDRLLNLVKIDLSFKNKFPSELSGGQLQRIVIAIALSKSPKLLLLDEPTTALDIASKNSILKILMELKKELGFLIIFVSHDIESIQDICSQIVILKEGIIYEKGNTKKILDNPQHKYTKKLIESNFNNREFRI